MLSKYLRATAALVAIAFSTLASADYAVDILPPVTPISHEIYDLHFGILWVCVAIFFVVFGAMFWSVFKHRKSVGAKASQFHENTTIEVIWTIVPFVILIGMAYPATKTILDMKDASNADISVKITAYQWKWEYDYQQDGVRFLSHLATPRDQIDERDGRKGSPKGENYLLEVDEPMVVPVGKKVRLLITSNDVIHGWYVPQLGVNQYGIPGFIKDAWFTIEKAGTYRGQCSQICGKEHGYMPIVVVAKEPGDYAAWVKDMKAKMPAPAPQAAPPATEAGGAPGPGATGASQQGATGAAQQVAAANPAPGAKADGKATYDTTCTACHGTGAAGAPKLGDKAAWKPRLAQGMDTLYASALKGKGAMPPKGGNTALPDAAVKAAVDYLAAAAK